MTPSSSTTHSTRTPADPLLRPDFLDRCKPAVAPGEVSAVRTRARVRALSAGPELLTAMLALCLSSSRPRIHANALVLRLPSHPLVNPPPHNTHTPTCAIARARSLPANHLHHRYLMLWARVTPGAPTPASPAQRMTTSSCATAACPSPRVRGPSVFVRGPNGKDGVFHKVC
jgi:hypothetical protein